MPYTSRSDAREFECPACGAGAGEKCVGARGKTRESVHRERMQRAARELRHAEVRTLTVDGDRLVSADGAVMGRIVGMEIDIQSEQWETVAGNLRRGEEDGPVVDVPRSEAKEETNTRGAGVPEQTALMPDPVEEVWAHYQQALDRPKAQLTPKVRKWIADAIKAVGVDDCKRAVSGLAASQYHRDNGYVGIEYALVPKKGQTIDSRVEMMAQKAGAAPTRPNGPTTLSSLMAHVPSDRHWIIEGRADDVRRAISNGRRDEGAEQFVRQHAKAEPVIEDGKMKGWRRVG